MCSVWFHSKACSMRWGLRWAPPEPVSNQSLQTSKAWELCPQFCLATQQETCHCLSFITLSHSTVIHQDVYFTQKIIELSLQGIQGSSCSHNSQTNKKYDGRDTFFSRIVWFPLTNSIINIFQSQTHNSKLSFDPFPKNHCFCVIYVKSEFLSPTLPKVRMCLLRCLPVILSKLPQKVRTATEEAKSVLGVACTYR